MSVRIEDYALIGDTRTVRSSTSTARSTGCACRGSIPARALPRCSASRSMAAGRSRRRRSIRRGCTRRYRDHTLVLETEITTPEGTVRIVDCMPPDEDIPNLVRIVEGVEGDVPMHMELIIRFDYGVDRCRGCARSMACSPRSRDPRALSLRTPVATHGQEPDDGRRLHGARRRTRAVRADVVSVDRPAARSRSTRIEAVANAERWWQEWAAQCSYKGAWRDAVVALADHAQGADVRADRRHRRGGDDVAARSSSAACATGTTATAGCATRRSRSTR